MKSKRTPIATAAVVLLSLMGVMVGAPAFADEPTTPPTGDVSVIEAPSTPEPVEEPVENAPAESPSPPPSPEPSPAAEPEEEPVADPPVAKPDPEPEADEPTDPVESDEPVGTPTPAPTKAPTKAPTAKNFPALEAGHPARNEEGWTSCWVTEINRTDVNAIDPYDMRTWPVYVTSDEGPHTGGAEEGSDIWIQVTRTDPRFTSSPVDGVTWTPKETSCEPALPGQVASGVSTMLNASGQAVGKVTSADPDLAGKVHAEIGEHLTVRTVFTVQFPKLVAITDLNGVPTTAWDQGDDQFRILDPQVNAFVGSPDGSDHGVLPEGVSVSCDSANKVYGHGDVAMVTCDTTGVVPTVTFYEYYQEGFDDATVFLSTSLRSESRSDRWDWGSSQNLQAGFPAYTVSPAQEWIPLVKDQAYRVLVDETLTVTPEGLLTGAEWSQGSLDKFDTYITNIPSGGKLVGNGDLEFTSKQIGNYDFNYYLQDPDTGTRSRSALGAIEVYDDSVIADPPVVTNPPTAENPVIPLTPAVDPKPLSSPPISLAHTGFDGTLLAGISLLLISLGLLSLRRNSRNAS